MFACGRVMSGWSRAALTGRFGSIAPDHARSVQHWRSVHNPRYCTRSTKRCLRSYAARSIVAGFSAACNLSR
jgi:hypothetical protein